MDLNTVLLEANKKLEELNAILLKMIYFQDELRLELKKLYKNRKFIKSSKVIDIEEYAKTVGTIFKIKEAITKNTQEIFQANTNKIKLKVELDILAKMIKNQPKPHTATILKFKKINASKSKRPKNKSA